MQFEKCFIHIYGNITATAIMNIYIFSKRFVVCLCTPSIPHSFVLLSQVTIGLLSSTIDSFAFPKILCKWNNAVCDYFVWVLIICIIILSSIHAFACVKNSLMLLSSILLMLTSELVILSSGDGQWVVSSFELNTNNAAMIICILILEWKCFQFSWIQLRYLDYVVDIFHFSRNYQTNLTRLTYFLPSH